MAASSAYVTEDNLKLIKW